MTLGELVKEHRRENGLSLRAFSRKAEISHSEVLRIEKGLRATPSVHILMRLAAAMEKPPEELLAILHEGE